MALNIKKVAQEGSGFRQPHLEAGLYPARVLQVIDTGLQPQRPWKGTEKPPWNEVRLVYELTDEFMVDEDGKEQLGKPRLLNEDFSVRSFKQEAAKSSKRYHALDPTGDFDGDFTQLVGAACNVMVVVKVGTGQHEGKTFNNIADVAAMRPRDVAKCPELVGEPLVFLLDEPDMEVFESFNDYLQDRITGNLNFKGSKLDEALHGTTKAVAEPPAGLGEEDIPW